MRHTSPNGVTLKSIFVGLIGSAFIALGIPYSEMVIQGSHMGIWNTTPAAIFTFFLLVAVVNVLLGVIHRPLALTPSELAVAYIMMLIANTIPSRGFTSYLIPIMTSAYYYATPENNWAEVIHPYLPDWIVVQDSRAIWQLYEGSPEGSVPWGAWIGPLAYWLLFAITLYLVMVCMMVILRKQWVEHERLIFPMAQLPIAMIQDDERGSLIKPLFKNIPMWLGFAIPFIIASINALHNYYPFVPRIRLGTSIPIFRRTAVIGISASPTMIGFSYFINRDIALGLCFFYLLNTIQRGILNITGLYGREEAMGIFSSYTNPIIIHQAMGGMIVLVLMGLWVARGHLKAVFRKAFRGDPSVDDSGEILSYRAAVFGCIGGLLILTIWLWRSGIPLLIVPMLLFGSFVLFLTETRAIAEGGVAAMFPPTNGPDFVVSGVGSSVLGPRGLAGLSFTYVWGTDILILLMAACANGLKLSDQIVHHKRRLFWAIMASIVVTLLLSTWVILTLAYKYGGINLEKFYFTRACQYPFEFMKRNVLSPSQPNVKGWIHTGIGGGIMLGLTITRHRFLWWPFHPLGFPISCVFGRMWFSVFLAWLTKGIILKYGGPRVYAKSRPFFLGLILGQLVVGGIWLIVDYFTGMTGNIVGAFMN